jgi:hypothetical protein
VAPARGAKNVVVPEEVAGEVEEGRPPPATARLEVRVDRRADDGKDGETPWKRPERRKRSEARVGVEEDRRLEVLQRGPHREPFVVVGGSAPAVSGRRQALAVVHGHRAGRCVSDGPNRQVREVGRLVGQHDPGNGCRPCTEPPRSLPVDRVNGQRAEADGHQGATRPRRSGGEGLRRGRPGRACPSPARPPPSRRRCPEGGPQVRTRPRPETLVCGRIRNRNRTRS